MMILSVLTSLALGADYAVPSTDYPTVQAAVAASVIANDTQAVVLVDPSYAGAAAEGTVLMDDFEGTIKSSVDGQRAEVPALHMITEDVQLTDLDVRLDYFDGGEGGFELWWAAIGVYALDGNLTATNVHIDGTGEIFEAYTIGILAQGASFLELPGETDGVFLTDVDISGMTAGAAVLFTEEVEITGGLIHDNAVEFSQLNAGSGVSIDNANSVTITGLTCANNDGTGGDGSEEDSACLTVHEFGTATVDGLTVTDSIGTPVHVFYGPSASLTNSSFSNTTDAFAGGAVFETVGEITLTDLTVTDAEGQFAGGFGIAAGFSGEGSSTVTASNITGTNLVSDAAGVLMAAGFVFVEATNLEGTNVEANLGASGLTLYGARGIADGITITGSYGEFGGAAAYLRELPFGEGPGGPGGPEGPLEPEGLREALEEVDCTEATDLLLSNASVADSLVYEGGVIYVEDGCVEADALSVENTVVEAGGVGIAYNSGLRMTDVTATDLDVDYVGGVVLAEESFISLNGAEVSNITLGFDGQEGPSGGGIVYAWDAFVTVQNLNGSGIEVDDGGFVVAEFAEVQAQCVHLCDVNTRYGGIAYYDDSGELLIEESSFTGVTASGEGAAMFEQGGGEVINTLTLRNSNFMGLSSERVMRWGTGGGEVAGSVINPIAGNLGSWGALNAHHNAFVDVTDWDVMDSLPGDPSVTFNQDLTLSDAGFLVYTPGECLPAGFRLASDSPLIDAGPLLEDGNPTDIGLFGSDNACPLPLDYDGDGFFDEDDCDDFDANVNPNATEIPYDGIDNDCADGDECDVDGDTFLEDGDACGGTDCDDSSTDFNPDATDTPYDGIDHNCDGLDPCDVDGDGYDFAGGSCGGDDCNDDDNTINPGAAEVPYDGIDNDCANGDECDVDGDGYLEDGEVCGGDDCNDVAESGTPINPGATEIPDDGIDQDCDGEDLLCDVDGDGFDAEGGICGGNDCDDTDAAFNPDATDTPYDGIDHNCDGLDPCDVDGDGFDHNNEECAGNDCNDNDPAINPHATDVPDDGIDQDCSGADTVCDADGDGYTIEQCGGDDCDDTDANVNTGADEVPYNGIDDDCDGSDLCDVDGDGHDAEACPVAGDDCNDDDATIYAGATDVPNDGIDQNCNGEDAVAWLQGGCSSTGGAGGPVWLLALLLPFMRRREVV